MAVPDTSTICANLTLADVDDDDNSMQFQNVNASDAVVDTSYYAIGRLVTGKSLLVLRRLQSDEDPETVELFHCDFWIQIHNLPVGFRLDSVVSTICSFLGMLVESDDRNFDGCLRTFYRVWVTVDISKPLKKQMKLKKNDGAWAFVNFRYERLPTFCFLCGIIGHGDKLCPKTL
ncbi:PREDICTED: uncharacterized protein LOC109156530 [Ipomoea nil]|uniref:uncharacterized protein LOC109156530 n=1 Tax=Ipomoea nil TaxID=35883 RepID=UPI000900EE26|nr:PREDICTED: uncharacterized protein LOC109156530 [Ipomoea nil]